MIITYIGSTTMFLITNVKEYGLSSGGTPLSLIQEKSYSYGDSDWKDKLTSYNGTTITYDEIGNPLSYRDGMSFTWESGRTLKSISTDGNTVNMKYDCNGMRVQKSDDNGTTYYYYDSDNNLIGLTNGTKTLLFYYDSDGNVTSFKYGGTMYYYVKNLQGDVIKIIDNLGNTVITYTYDAWGNILKETMAETGGKTIRDLNPFKYRSYIYDKETGLYYLQSRYYDPTTGRFLNADDTQYLINKNQVLSTNTYTYCFNNPISCIDKDGKFALTLLYNIIFLSPMGSLGVITYIGITLAQAVSNFYNNQQYSFSGYIYNQAKGNAANIKMGFYTGDYNGCAWVAVYNAMVALNNNHIKPCNIVFYFEFWGSILSGTFGVLPDAVADYLKHIGYKNVESFYTPSNRTIDSTVKKYRAAIIFYAHSNGCHYILVRYDKNNNMFYAYNVFSDSEGAEKKPSIQELLINRGYYTITIIGIK